MEERAWVLDDAEQLNREAPDCFFIPPEGDRRDLSPGDVVKLVFRIRELAPGGIAVERMWVEVLEVAGTGNYVGRLLNDPSEIAHLHAGEEIWFEARHVAAKDYSPEELGYDAGAHAAVNKRVRGRGERPRRLIYNADAGYWYVFVGDENRREREVGDNFEWWSLGDLTDHFPAMTEAFQNAERGGYWDLSSHDGTYTWSAF